MLIADLHLGFELELAREGVYIPDRTDGMVERVLALGPASGLMIVGDLKHSIGLSSGFRVRRFLEGVSPSYPRVVLTVGNHDGSIASVVGDSCELRGPRGAPLGDAWIFHGHAIPPPDAGRYEFGVMGHVHPAIFLRGVGKVPVWLVAETTCDFVPPTLVVMPAFNDMLGYGNLLGMRERGPVFPKCIDPDATDVLTLDGRYLGTLSYLSKEKGLLSPTWREPKG